MKTSKIDLAKEAFKHKGFIQKIPVIIRMMKSIFSKNGYKPQFKNIIIPGVVLVYIISPIDIIPDWIPAIGALDDLTLIALVIPLLMKETENFVSWEAEKKTGTKIIDAEIVK